MSDELLECVVDFTMEEDDLRVPTIERMVEVVLADGHRRQGTIFLPDLPDKDDAAMCLHEWANDGRPFFPFFEQGTNRPVLLNKRNVAVISARSTSGEARAFEGATATRLVVVWCGERSMSGELRIEMPPEQARVFDYICQGGEFLPLWSLDGRDLYMIRKGAITEVVDTKRRRA